MIAIVNYGVGNLFSLRSSFAYIGAGCVVTGDPGEISRADKIVLPGVGAFADAAAKLRDSGLGEVVREEARKGKPLLGICLGMQLLLDRSHEYGESEGLGLVPGEVVPIASAIPAGLKIPHIGWNALLFPGDRGKHPVFKYLEPGEHVYFVHSFYATNCSESIAATTEYGAILTAAVARGNICGVQFHPEKSGNAGLRILKAFCEMEERA